MLWRLIPLNQAFCVPQAQATSTSLAFSASSSESCIGGQMPSESICYLTACFGFNPSFRSIRLFQYSITFCCLRSTLSDCVVLEVIFELLAVLMRWWISRCLAMKLCEYTDSLGFGRRSILLSSYSVFRFISILICKFYIILFVFSRLVSLFFNFNLFLCLV